MSDTDATVRLHRALIELCYERDYATLTVEELCERARVPRAVFVARYADLDDCFAEALSECADEFLERMTRAYDETEGRWQDRLRAAAYTSLAHMQEDPARAHFTVVESLNGGERAQLVVERVFATLSRFLDDGRKLRAAPGSLTPVTAESLNGAIAHHMRVGIERLETDRVAEVLPQLMYTAVLRYLGPEAAAEELEYAPPVPLRRPEQDSNLRPAS